MFKKRDKKRSKKQSGLVSLIVVAILAVVLGLVAVGFSQLMDREAGRALDNELSAQAYYAAVSGLNDARAWLRATDAQYDLTGCSDWKSKPLGPAYFTSSLDSTANTAKYSCVSIDTAPSNLAYQLGAGQSMTFSVNEPTMDRMYFGWQNQAQGPFVPLGPSVGSLPQITTETGGATGLLEVNLYAVPVGLKTTVPPGDPSDTNAILSAASRTYYMYPNLGNGGQNSVDYLGGNAQNGNFVPGNCSTSPTNPLEGIGSTAQRNYCNAYIDNMNQINSQNTYDYQYYVRLTARYAPLNVTVQGATANAASVVNQLSGAQAVVDVTGQGTDVLQRIRARVNLSQGYQTPAYGLQSMEEVCKGFDVELTDPGQYGDASVDDSVTGFNYNSACATPVGGGPVGSTANDQKPHHGLPPITNPYPLITATLSAVPTTIYSGQTSALTWVSSGATTCAGVRVSATGPGFNTGNAPNGSTTLTFPTAGTYTYQVRCTGVYGTGNSNPVTINVNTPPKPTANLTASPTMVWGNEHSTLTWSSTNATTCAGTGFAAGGNTSGSASVGPLTAGTHSFTITCTGPGGTATHSATVTESPQNCTATATQSGGTATGSGSCAPASYLNPEWTFTYTAKTQCGTDTGSGSGNSIGFGGEGGTFTVIFTIHGLYGGTKSATITWTQPGNFC